MDGWVVGWLLATTRAGATANWRETRRKKKERLCKSMSEALKSHKRLKMELKAVALMLVAAQKTPSFMRAYGRRGNTDNGIAEARRSNW
jgi:hypothetical protein